MRNRTPIDDDIATVVGGAAIGVVIFILAFSGIMPWSVVSVGLSFLLIVLLCQLDRIPWSFFLLLTGLVLFDYMWASGLATTDRLFDAIHWLLDGGLLNSG